MGGKFAGVKPVSKTSIEITFSYKGRRCRERVKLEPTPTNLKRVVNWRGEILNSIENGTFNYAVSFPNSPRAKGFSATSGQDVASETLLVSDYLDKWLKSQKAIVKASVWDNYRKDVNNTLLKAFGDFKLADLKLRHIRDWAANHPASQKRINNILSILRIALNQAVGDELIDANPLYGWSFKKLEPPRRKRVIDPFTLEEQAAILGAMKGQEKNLYQFAFWSGLRTSELVALEWGDIDWINGYIVVTRGLTQVAKTAEVPKTHSSTRRVKILPPALAALQAQKSHTQLHPGGIVFHNPRTGSPWIGDKSMRETVWKPALKRAGVRYRYPYQTRHSYASMMLTAGENPLWVASQMGHADTQMIFRHYGRWIKDADEHAGGKAVAMFAPTTKP